MNMPNKHNNNDILYIPLSVYEEFGEVYPARMTFSIPLLKGSVTCLSQLRLIQNNQQLNCNAKITGLWNDQSIRWIVIDFIYQNYFTDLALQVNPTIETKNSSASGIDYHLNPSTVDIKTSGLEFNYDFETTQFTIKPQNGVSEQLVGYVELVNDSLITQAFSITSHNFIPFIDLLDGSIQKASLSIELCGSSETNTDLHSELIFTFHNQDNTLSIQHTLHNAKAATHPNGHWDLGDKQSFIFGSAKIVFTGDCVRNVQLQTQTNSPWNELTESNFTLLQCSSGGENWQSPVHINQGGELPFTHKGAVLSSNSFEDETILRVTPSVIINKTWALTFEKFWQNFPKALTREANSLSWHVFPSMENQLHELQGGESKTHKMWLALSAEKSSLNWVHQQPQSIPSSDWIEKVLANQLTFLSQDYGKFGAIIDAGIIGTDNFFQKRENLDEYGWRNFGDIYADHETAEYDGQAIFVSHYNNQYDAIWGFLRQYLRSKDKRWLELADDLAKHVKNIDTYQTTEDKAEYNGGLFWHTDHYLQAYTSTHRSYSKHQAANAYQDHAGGGGPGGQHCYTTGLALHYFLLGDESSKQTVLTLTTWISQVYEGSGTCLELLLALKNRHMLGVKNHFSGQYPLDRGTANYVVALLDSFELSQDRNFLHQAQHVIENTVHPYENVILRNLTDVETTWFYTVFLQALSRYLSVKEACGEIDDHFYYARDCLINFANWMVDNEYMYLDKPEILEYPNDTWTAQDLRKAHVLAAAYHYACDNNSKYLAKAEYFENEVAARLNSCATKTYTRIMVLVLQNSGAVNFYKNRPLGLFSTPYKQDWPQASYEKSHFFIDIIKAMGKRLIRISLKNEISWLKKRLK
jgi:hypothetical protein